MSSPDPILDQLIGREVVVDVSSQYIYLGKLAGHDHKYLILEQADVHDLRDTSTTRENYIVDSKRHGIRENRVRVYVRVGEVVSLSALDEVIV
ncbi:MAG: hypothetical protein ACT4QC_06855 [Planctomycetaceae bacterium]